MISRIVKKNGNRMFEIDGKLFTPAAFRSFRPTPANVSLFYRNGIRLFQMQCTGIINRLGMPYSTYGAAWIGDHKYDFSVLDRQMEMFQKFAPDGYFMIMPVLDMPDWWREENNCPVYSFYQLGEAVYKEKWIADACDFLKALAQYAENKYGDRIFAYSFAAGRTTEWFDGSGAPSEKKGEIFRKAVNDPSIRIPTIEDIKDKSLPTLLDNDSPLFLYKRFCSDLTPKLIMRFAKALQEVIDHQKVVGIFYGYSALPVGWQNQTATTGYEQVWACDDIDMFFAPAEYYGARLPDGSSTYQSTVDSLYLHEKLYLHEIDHRTYLANYPMETGVIMKTDYKTEEETIRILRRELACAAVKDASLWWFDFIGGYYASPGLEAELRLQMGILDRLSKIPHKSVSEIAVFVDPYSFHHMKDQTHITVDLVGANRDSLNQCGAPYDYFNQNDLPLLDTDKYKMFVFLTPLEITKEVKEVIKTKLADKTVVWLYAPNIFSGGVDEICNIKLKNIDDPNQKPVYNGKKFGFHDPTLPLFAVDDTDAQILAAYGDGSPACAKKNGHIYIAQGCVPSELWRDIAKDAGVHIYTDVPGSLYVDSRFIARQTMNTEDIELHLPFDCTLEELFDGGEYQTENGVLRYHCKDGATKMFLIKDKT